MKKNEKMAGLTFLFLLSGLGIAALFIVLFSKLGEKVMEDEFGLFDSIIIAMMETGAGKTMDNIMFIFTEMGSVWFLTTLSFIVLAVLWFKMKDKWGILFFVIAVGGGSLLTLLLKHLYLRERPSINAEIDAIGYSFPSGHSMGSLIFYGFIIYLVLRTNQREWVKVMTAVVLSILIVLIGSSRIYLGAHFPSDVLAGYIAGFIWLLLSLIALEWIQWQSRSQVPPVRALRKLLEKFYNKLQMQLPFLTK